MFFFDFVRSETLHDNKEFSRENPKRLRESRITTRYVEPCHDFFLSLIYD